MVIFYLRPINQNKSMAISHVLDLKHTKIDHKIKYIIMGIMVIFLKLVNQK